MEREQLRVGIGWDSHSLVSGRRLVLGGVDIPYDKGLSGWSDADVASHAIIDALCGAGNVGDIGTLFPAQQPEYKDVQSLALLSKTRELLETRRCRIVNIDVTIIAEAPKLAPFIAEMRRRISQALDIDSTRVTVKATTTNNLGFIGRGEGMAAQAVALIRQMEG
jgi:2-C-methyl-D-erythritol 4-phosphate cytidylyltransferase / 2-C-methyl-D-erythritol 2,4-cyclodiphosphate synthase